MSDLVNNLSGKVGLDVTDYKTGVTEINRAIRVIESGFRASAAALGDWDKQEAGVEQRMNALTNEIILQQRKVGLLTDEHKKMVAEKGELSRAALDLQAKINKETETLNKMQKELTDSKSSLEKMGTGAQQAGKDVKQFGDEESKAEKKTFSFKGALEGLGGILKGVGIGVAAIGAGVAAAWAGISALVMKVADLSGELVDTSLKAGINVEKLQELKYIGVQVGTSLDTMTGALSRFTVNMGKVGKDKTLASTFKTLGVSVRDANGQLRDSDSVFFEAIDALGRVENETQRDILANQLFGKSYMELNPLIKAGGKELERLKEQAHATGAVMSEETVANFEAFGDTVEGLKLSLQRNMGTILGTILPGFQSLATGAQGYMQQLSLLFLRSDGDMGKFASGLGDMLGRIISAIAKQMPGLVSAGTGILQGIINVLIANLPIFLPAIVQILNTLVNFIVQNISLLVPAAIQILTTLINAIVQMMPMIIPAAIQILLTLTTAILGMLPMLIQSGFQILIMLITGITQAIPSLIPAILLVIPQIITTLIENLPLLIMAALQLLMALAQGLVEAIPVLYPQIPKIVQAIVTMLIQNLPQIIIAAVQIIAALALGLIENLPLVIKTILDIIVAVIDAFKNTDWKSVGDNIVQGIKDGFLNMWDNFKKDLIDRFKNLVKDVKDLLKMHSPSRVFFDIGGNMASGMGLGFTDQMKAVNRQVRNAVNNLSTGAFGSGNINLGLAGIGGGSSQTLQFYAPVIVQGAAGETLADMLSQRRY